MQRYLFGDRFKQTQSRNGRGSTAPKSRLHRDLGAYFAFQRWEPGDPVFSREKPECPLDIILALERLIHKAKFEFLLRVISRLDDAHTQVELHSHCQGVEARAEVGNGCRN